MGDEELGGYGEMRVMSADTEWNASMYYQDQGQ